MNNHTEAADKIIKQMVKRIVKRFDPEKIILFGSYARGTAGPNSDVDLLIVMRVAGSKRKQRLDIRIALNGVGLAKEIIVATPEEVEKYQNVVGTIIRPALQEGKVLHERAA